MEMEVPVPRRRNAPASSSTFNIGIKPKDPPYFNGRANEDVDTWLAKVGDFLYLTEANNRQQVAYTATLLQEAASDWWMSLLKGKTRGKASRFSLNLLVYCRKDLAAVPGWIERGQIYEISNRPKQRQFDHTPQDLKPCWLSCRPSMQNGRKPSLSGDYINEWQN